MVRLAARKTASNEASLHNQVFILQVKPWNRAALVLTAMRVHWPKKLAFDALKWTFEGRLFDGRGLVAGDSRLRRTLRDKIDY